jgi:hypothetical protein
VRPQGGKGRTQRQQQQNNSTVSAVLCFMPTWRAACVYAILNQADVLDT